MSSDILNKIVTVKHEEVAAAKRRTPLERIRFDAESRVLTRDFVGAMRAKIAAGQAAVIAEVKKASPSKGIIREDFIPADIAQSYAEGDGTAGQRQRGLPFSAHGQAIFQERDRLPEAGSGVLRPAGVTEGFHGRCMADLRVARDRRRCHPADRSGAHDAQMKDFEAIALGLGMAVLVEVHDAVELDRALRLKTPLVGVNNRNLRNFEVSIQTTIDLLPRLPADRLLVTESGIATRDDVAALRAAGVQAFLVGEAFMRAKEPGEALADLFK